ncbi:MAG: 4-hydroxy-tetrahydrodipicolinate synthase, partial [Endozoicomonadaceae bacterium]|nr:4-hydroxy-tetrahydrodipicolinate synthase [Endozoicomonadaceae bacterium]
STEQTIYLTEQARVLGANACLLVVPYYNRPGQEGLYQHFHRIAERVPVAQILYNVPGRTITDLLPETVVRLMDHPNIIGIKEATGDIERAKMLINAAEGKNFAVYSGDDLTAFELMLCGGKGVISVTANIAPAKMHKMCSETLRGHTEEAKAIDQQLSGLNKALFVEANPVPVKWALNKMRKIQNGIRLPLMPLRSESHPVVSEAMKSSGIVVSEM